MDIFANHQKGGAGATAVLLTKQISLTDNLDPEWWRKWVFDTIRWEYDRISDGESAITFSLGIKECINLIYLVETLDLNGVCIPDCFFLIALTLHHSINGNEKEAWITLVDASWLAGFIAKDVKANIQTVDSAIQGHRNTRKRKARNSIQDQWTVWQNLTKTDLPAAKALYRNKTAFAYEMLNQFPVLEGAKTHDTNVILGWIRGWENPKKLPTTTS